MVPGASIVDQLRQRLGENAVKPQHTADGIVTCWIARLGFCILCQGFRPFHKGLEDFPSVRIQSGVAENPLLPSGVT
jgi:hypothetical protein